MVAAKLILVLTIYEGGGGPTGYAPYTDPNGTAYGISCACAHADGDNVAEADKWWYGGDAVRVEPPAA